MPLGIRNFLNSLQKKELQDWATNLGFYDDLNSNQIRKQIQSHYMGKSQLFFREYLQFAKKVIQIKCKDNNVQFILCQKILFSLSSNKSRKESVIIREIGNHPNYSTCLQLLKQYNLVEHKYKRNLSYYDLSIPFSLRNHISIFIGESNELDQNLIKSSLSALLDQDYEKTLIITILNVLFTTKHIAKEKLIWEVATKQKNTQKHTKEVIESTILKLAENNVIMQNNNSLKLVMIVKNHFSDIKSYLESYTKEFEPDNTDQWIDQFIKSGIQDPVALAYFEEAAIAFRENLKLGSAFLLGATSELLMNNLFDVITKYLGSSFQKDFNKLRSISKKMNKIEHSMRSLDLKTLEQELALKGKKLAQEQIILLRSEFSSIIKTIFNCYRLTRNDTGHPSMFSRSVDLDEISLLFQTFPTYTKKIKQLLEIFQ